VQAAPLGIRSEGFRLAAGWAGCGRAQALAAVLCVCFVITDLDCPGSGPGARRTPSNGARGPILAVNAASLWLFWKGSQKIGLDPCRLLCYDERTAWSPAADFSGLMASVRAGMTPAVFRRFSFGPRQTSYLGGIDFQVASIVLVMTTL
jgi:hypothetical protein